VRSQSKTSAATPAPMIQQGAADPRFILIDAGLLYVGNTSGTCACSTIGYGYTGRCLMHASLPAESAAAKIDRGGTYGYDVCS